MMLRYLSISLVAILCRNVDSFAPLSGGQPFLSHTTTQTRTLVSLDLAAGGQKKRRRKQPPVSPTPEPVPAKPSVEKIEAEDDIVEDLTEEQVFQIGEVAKFDFKTDKEVTKGIEDDVLAQEDTGGAIPLPDIKQALRRKAMEEEIAQMEKDKEEKKVRIKRTDKEAMRRLLEQQPFADSDASYFEEEVYGTVSALLGEGAKPFLGIPLGPLQAGHFIGALGIVLMAFIDYPGFPLTNLPTPIRDALQGGLGTVYLINLVLAVVAAFKAGERGQPIPLWVAKTFSIGGIAYDQLTQLPTLAEIKELETRKGARAVKNKK